MSDVNGNGRFRVSIGFALQLASMIVAIMLAYNSINARIAIIETKYDYLSQQIASMNYKLDRLLDRNKPVF